MVDCLFCGIASGSVPADVVAQDDDVVVFRDINPKAPVHLLAIPRRHVASIATLTDDDSGVVDDVVHALRRAAVDAGLESYRIVSNIGPDAGQSVAHLHVHLLAGRRLGWPPG